jgi:hypothetical protein
MEEKIEETVEETIQEAIEDSESEEAVVETKVKAVQTYRPRPVSFSKLS